MSPFRFPPAFSCNEKALKGQTAMGNLEKNLGLLKKVGIADGNIQKSRTMARDFISTIRL